MRIGVCSAGGLPKIKDQRLNSICCGNLFLSFPRKRESILLSGKAAFVAMDPCFRRGDRLSATGTKYQNRGFVFGEAVLMFEAGRGCF